MPKPLTLKDFILRAQQIHKGKYSYSKTTYINSNTKVVITCHNHGDFEQIPHNHLNGSGCPRCKNAKLSTLKTWTTDDFLQKATQIHGNKYNYSKVEYKGNSIKVIIICPEHGEFLQIPGSHLNGNGCKTCSAAKTALRCAHTTESFITKARKVHASKYSYAKVVYKNNTTKVTITCPTHGDFTQQPQHHTKGAGCPVCAKFTRTSNTWTYSGWEEAGQNSQHFKNYSLYVLECWDNEEHFFKVGKTYIDIARRYSCYNALPYEWRLVHNEVGSARYISELEVAIQQALKEYRYTPKKPFGGQFECFCSNDSSNNKTYIKELIHAYTNDAKGVS